MKEKILKIAAVFALLFIGYEYIDFVIERIEQRAFPISYRLNKIYKYYKKNSSPERLSEILQNLKRVDIENLQSDKECDVFREKCFEFSKGLFMVFGKLMQQECPKSTKTLFLQMVYDLNVIAEKLKKRSTAAGIEDYVPSTVSFECLSMKILAKMNDIVFDGTLDTFEKIEPILLEITKMLNEEKINNIAIYILPPLKYHCPKLIEQLHKKLIATNCYGKIPPTHATRKLLDQIREFIEG